jgi:DNA topoisomerase I
VSKPLVIVESPAKARTIGEILGDQFVVTSSVGHIRDLPRNAAEVPATHKGEKWARLGIDVDNDFKPLYIVSAGKKDVVKALKDLVKDATELYLATDEDREGEAIAWHLLETLSPRIPVKRMVFHEITPEAIQRAIDEPRDLDRRLVDAQEARRLLDRLYGYEVSPVLWKKVLPQLSAGRVQSVATRIVVERERERMAFVAASYWDIVGTFAAATAGDDAPEFSATLVSVDQAKVATSKDFDSSGTLTGEAVALDAAAAESLAAGLADADFRVRSVESRPYRRRPAPPFMTSTFQQEASRKLRMSSAQAMRAAQTLYEQGYITYMRTDSTTLSETALTAARAEIVERYGEQFLPDEARLYTKKVKNAQEAHEAIRPAGERFRSPDEVAAEVGPSEARAYEMIWNRTVASQMTDAVGETVTVRLGAVATDGRDAEFSTSGTVITHQGFRRVYVEDTDEASDDAQERRLPAMAEGDGVVARELVPDGHETQPPSRFNEASLIKRLEELGVGRPSTYASIMGTIQERGYVWKKGQALVPSFTAFSVVQLLERHFPDLVDYAFTARMEDDLDSIAGGDKESIPWLSRFYFGETSDDADGLKAMVSDRLAEIDARDINSIPIGVDSEGVPVVARVGRYGPYLQRGDDTAGIPDELAPDEITIDRAIELLAAPSGDRELGTDPETGLPVLAKAGRFGPYVQVGEIDDAAKTKPKTASLFKDMQLDSVTLDDALRLLSLPRTVGVDPADGVEITVQNGRYGPYLKKGNDSRSLETEDQLFTVTLEECLRILAEPKRRRGQTVAPPLREMGDDPVSGKPMVVKDGRFGPYVTDGDTNASLRKGDTVENLTDERASELLEIRRAAGPAKKRAKKAPAKKAPAKKAAKKAPAKKAAKKAPAKMAANKVTGTAPDEAAPDVTVAEKAPDVS